jgi:hypothetical protein
MPSYFADAHPAGEPRLVGAKVLHRTGGRLVGQAAFSPDGSVLAVADTHSTLALLDAATGRPLAALRTPTEEFVQYFCFSRDGTRLAVSSATSDGIDVWDLREVRRGLAELGLDWNLPPYSTTRDPEPGHTTRLRVVVDAGDLGRKDGRSLP